MRRFGRCEQVTGKANPMQCEGGINGLGQVKTVNRVVLPLDERVRLDGKFFRLGDEKFWVKGVTYGPFEPRPDGICLPPQEQLEADLRLIAAMGANTIRVYHVPPRDLLDIAHSFGLKVFVDVPWSKHRCFLESPEDMESGRHAVREAARACKDHPALLALSRRQRGPDRRRPLARPGAGRALHRRARRRSPARKTRRLSSPSPASRPPSTSTRRRSTSTR